MDLIFANMPSILISVFFAVLFLQSGLDKVIDYGGNLEYFRGHFKNSPLARSVGLLLPSMLVLEILTGSVSAWALFIILVTGQSNAAFYSASLAGVSLLCLFFGQRVAKDYGGAASLVPYFIVALLGLWVPKM